MSSERPDLDENLTPEKIGDEQRKPTVAPLFPVQGGQSADSAEDGPEDAIDLDSPEY